MCFVSGFDRSMFAADSTELCSSDECAMKLRECIILNSAVEDFDIAA